MPRQTKKGAAKAGKDAKTAPALKTHALFVRVTPAMADEIEAVARELTAAAEASGDARQWSQADVVRAILAKRLRDREPGELP